MKLRIDDLLTMIAQVTVLKKKVEKHKYLRQAEREVADTRIANWSWNLKKNVKKLVMIGMIYLLVVVL